MRLSAHFEDWEFRCPHCGRLVGPDPKLLEVLERIRAIDDRPLLIVSGYRCPAFNRKIGGARFSQHLYGRAADIRPGRATLKEARAAGAVGVGLKGRWATHVDVRPGRRATWRY